MVKIVDIDELTKIGSKIELEDNTICGFHCSVAW
jgi:hypothetical protein